MDVRLLLLRALADEQKEGREEFLCVHGVAAKDGFEDVALQLVLGGAGTDEVVMGAGVKAACGGGVGSLTWLWMSRR